MAPPDPISTDLVPLENRSTEWVGTPPVADGLASPLLGASLMPPGAEQLSQMGANSYTAVTPSDSFSANGASSPGIFRSLDDFMTGGNRTHNAQIDQLVTQVAIRIIEEQRGECLCSERAAEIRRFVHDELRHYKVNTGRQRNGNVDHADFGEILEHTVHHFGGRVEGSEVPAVLETNEHVHARIEQMIEEELNRPENSRLWEERGLDGMETLRATLRTRLHAEFAQILMNEAYTENLSEVSDFFRGSIVDTFETRAPGIVASTLTESMVCRQPTEGGPSVVADTAVSVGSSGGGPRVVQDTTGIAPANEADLEARRLLEAEIRRQVPALAHGHFDGAVRLLAREVLRARQASGGEVAFDASGRALFPVETEVTRILEADRRAMEENDRLALERAAAEIREAREARERRGMEMDLSERPLRPLR
ncbi:MAG TPA: hypothetical protein VLJ37_11800 [bacterium]|nr:hypothetical protein [bacterium]